MLINRDGLIWVGRRLPKWDGDGAENLWQMPQGGIDEGETPAEAALRELHEEIGTDKAVIVAEADEWLQYDLPEKALGIALKGKYRGQTQKWFVMRFEGADDDVDISGGHEKPEFDKWKWVAIEELPALAVDFKRHIYEALVEKFQKASAEIARQTGAQG